MPQIRLPLSLGPPTAVLVVLAVAACNSGSSVEMTSTRAAPANAPLPRLALSSDLATEAQVTALPATAMPATQAAPSAAPDPATGDAGRTPIVPAVVMVTPVTSAAPALMQGVRRAVHAYELVGTMLAPGRDSAVLRDAYSQERWTVRAGDHLDDVAVSEIKADRVVLTSAHGAELVFFGSRGARPVVETAPDAADPEASPSRPAPVPQYTGPSGDTPTYEEPAQDGQPTGH